MELVFGTVLKCKESGDRFTVLLVQNDTVHYLNTMTAGSCLIDEVDAIFDIEPREPLVGDLPPSSVLNVQEGGDHYKKLGPYQPWEVLRAWLTPEEFRGYMKGTAIAYLAREQDKGGDMDIKKAAHTLQGLVELGFDNGC